MKLIGVLLCMGGTIIVSLGDSEGGSSKVALNPALGDILCIVSAGFYAVYISLIRKKLPNNEDGKQGNASMAQFLGFVGLFNLLIFLPIALVVSIAKLENFNNITGKQFGLIIGKGTFKLFYLHIFHDWLRLIFPCKIWSHLASNISSELLLLDAQTILANVFNYNYNPFVLTCKILNNFTFCAFLIFAAILLC